MICAECGEQTGSDPCGHCGAEALLAGRYRLERELGRGASGTTFCAVDTETDARVAVKEMPIGRASSAKARELLDREAAVLAQLDHPAIPALLASMVIGEGRNRAVVLVQSFVDGVDLREEMAHHRYSPVEVLELAGELLDVLVYLHDLSPPIVHRDIKPANVMRRTDGALVLLDFGSVRDTLRDLDLGGSTVAGTFGYMAPEQLVGDASPMSDLYGLGALMVHLLSRVDPQQMLSVGGGLAWEGRVRVPEGLRSLLSDLLQPDPDLRTAALRSTGAVRERVRRLLSDPTALEGRALPVAPPPRPVRTPDQSAVYGLVGLSSIALLLVGGATLTLASRGTPEAPVFVVEPAPAAVIEPLDVPQEEIPQQPEPARPAEPPKFVDVWEGDLKPLGPPNAPVKIVMFSDYQCPFCARAMGTLEELLGEREGQIAVYMRDFPLDFHTSARDGARGVRCADAQGRMWAMHDALFEAGRQFDRERIWTLAQGEGLDTAAFSRCMNDPATDARIDRDIADGKKAQVQGTPTFFVNGERIVGAQSKENFEAAIDRALQRL